ncbi:MAG: universal stress protein [Myxococcaceae bacterium]|nr:universal stress protein [Myxococcaceae bacterium]
MSVLCGFDLSRASQRAATVAAALARARREPLVLVYAVPPWPNEWEGSGRGELLAGLRRALDRETERLRGPELAVSARLVAATPVEALAREAADSEATLVVLGSAAPSERMGGRAGRLAERLAQRSPRPTLVVRDAEPWLAWLSGGAPLEVLVGVEPGPTSEAAWRFAVSLGALAPVKVTGAHLYWPPHEFKRLGLTGVRSYVDVDPEVARVLERELSARLPGGPGATVGFFSAPSLGRPADHLASLGAERGVHLLVVGTHRRSFVERLWEGSVSRGLLRGATVAAACVPAHGVPVPAPPEEPRHVLAATDLTALGNATVEAAFAQAGEHGAITVVHVLEPPPHHRDLDPHDVFEVSAENAPRKAQVLAELTALGTSHGAGRLTPLVLESHSPAKAIAQAAERVGATLVLVGTRVREGSRPGPGAVLEGVLQGTTRPVLVVRPPGR